MLPHLSLQGHRPQVYSSSTPVCRGPMAQSSASLSQDVCWEALSVQQHHAFQKESKQAAHVSCCAQSDLPAFPRACMCTCAGPQGAAAPARAMVKVCCIATRMAEKLACEHAQVAPL